CGIHYFDSDAYPEPFREKLYMGNIHGNCINSDSLRRDGSTYFATPNDDFLSANDAWFMPVVQKTGPDGCLYILDWYDRYHCYQDANRDPKGIDRLKGRLYRVRYRNTPRARSFDLTQESEDELIARLRTPNVYYRDVAQRLLWERANAQSLEKLQRLVLDDGEPRKARLHALWTLIGAGPLDSGFHQELLHHTDATFRAWGVRAAGNEREVAPQVRDQIVALVDDSSRDVLLQVVIVARKLQGVDALDVLYRALANSADDKLIPHIVWQNLHPLLETEGDRFLALVKKRSLSEQANVASILPRVLERLLGRSDPDPRPVAALVEFLLSSDGADPALAGRCLALLASKVQSHELAGPRLERLRAALDPIVTLVLDSAKSPLHFDAAMLAATWKDEGAVALVRKVLVSPDEPEGRRLQALGALVFAGDPNLLDEVAHVLTEHASVEFRRGVLDALGRAEPPDIAGVVLAAYPSMEPEL
ncbi:MAG: DUF7133 domain-containing protein, partial [Pirellulales bacterium]